MEKFIRFVLLVPNDRFSVRERCEQLGISRKTGHKHLERDAPNGLKGLQARSHRLHEFPHPHR